MNTAPELYMTTVMNSRYADMRPVGVAASAYRMAGLKKYRRQLAETRSALYQKEALKLLTGGSTADSAKARREKVLRRVTREFWTNFAIRGEETAMLRQMQDRLRREFGRDLEFFYPPGDIQMIILRKGDTGNLEPVDPHEQTAIINRAWQLAREMVADQMMM